MGFAKSVATTVHLFAGGLSVEQGVPEKVLGDPQHPVTKSFLREAGL
jgi:polar amino acid transport system ATP-binding protein